MIRHLLYNCCALTHSDEWKLNVDRLVRYPDAFNGRRLVLIKTGPGIADPSEIEPLFAPLGECEFIQWPNDPHLKEIAGFIETLEKLQGEEGAVFYAHTKGAKYAGVPEEYMEGIRRWRDRMYYELLRDPEVIDAALAKQPAVGCFRMKGNHPPLPPGGKWHFAGTFWWLRLEELFKRDWRGIDRGSCYGIEAYPGTLFKYQESVCVYGDQPSYDLYMGPGVFVCENCNNEFKVRMTPHVFNKRQICKKCHKRRGVFVRTEEPPP